MSHFTVLVIGDNPEEQIAPYHEYECTGRDDQYVKEIDRTDEARESYEESTSTMVRAPDGSVHSYYDDVCYRDPTPEELKEIGPFGGSGRGKGISYDSKDWGDGKGYRAKVHETPPEWEKFEEPTSNSKTFAEYIESYYGWKTVPHGEEPNFEETHKYGYVLLDENGEVKKAVDRTNPEAKWDWYELGGRWRGYFKLKEGAIGKLGQRGGVFDKEPEPGTADQLRKGDVDFEGMRTEAMMEAAEFFDKFADLFENIEMPEPWEKILEKYKTNEHVDIEAAREEYSGHPLVKALRQRAKELDLHVWDLSPERFIFGDRAAYIARARAQAIASFAVVMNGKWYEKGEMGWWACVSNEKDPKDWLEEFNKLLDSVPDDTLLTLFDCHI